MSDPTSETRYYDQVVTIQNLKALLPFYRKREHCIDSSTAVEHVTRHFDRSPRATDARRVGTSETTTTLSGFAAVYDQRVDLGGGIYEIIEQGAFCDAVTHSDALALVNHDPSLLIGRQSSGTLRLRDTSRGLWSEIDVADTPLTSHYIAEIRRGDLRGQSFSFMLSDAKTYWSGISDDSATIHLERIDKIFDCGPVSWPAYEATTIAIADGRSASGRGTTDAETCRWRRWVENLV